MEYRSAFIAQAAGMFLNNAFYFAFWVLFFDRFEQVRGWQLDDMVLLFAIVACGFGLAAYLFGNSFRLAEVVAEGRLDYYLALPRPVLPHLLASRSVASGMGDVTYGLVSFLLLGAFSADAVLRFIVATALSMIVLLSFLVLVQSLVFWLGGAAQLGQQAVNAMVTLAIYPVTLFDGSAKLILFTVLPAAFVGAVPAEFVRSPSWTGIVQLMAVAGVMAALALVAFYRGLRRYESGSALQVQV
jgi:ABC-2 type transport system permease protein